MGASCDLVPAPPPWPPSPRSLIESSSTQTTWSAPQSCPPPETVSLARWSTRVEAAYYALSFICIVIFSCFAIAALVQRNDQFILGEAVISNIIYVLHHHIYNTWLFYFQYNIPRVLHTIVAAQIYIMIQIYPVSTRLHYRIQVLSIVRPSIDWYNGSYLQRGWTILPFMLSSV